ncbi:MAG: response regulator [Bryobacteraceae bacterium]
MSAPVVAIILDLFFAVKVQAAAKQSGLVLKMAGTADAAAKLLGEGASLLVVDLNCREVDTVALIRGVKGDPELRRIPVLGFVSHVQVDRKAAAEQAGCDRVVARSVFSDRTAGLLGEMAAAG